MGAWDKCRTGLKALNTAGPGGRGAADGMPGVRRHSGRALRMAFVLDVAGYGTRTVPDRDAVQQRLRRLVVATLAECGLKLDERAVDHQWTGDGINAILPADIDPTAVLAVLLRSLAADLGARQRGAMPTASGCGWRSAWGSSSAARPASAGR